MKVNELLEARHKNWLELEQLCGDLDRRRSKGRLGHTGLVRFAALYRGACADLALADAFQLPTHTIAYLHQLVGRAHNQLYPSRGFRFRAWASEMLLDVPRRLFRDWSLRLSFLLFWGVFLVCMFLAAGSQEFAERAVGAEALSSMEAMHAQSIGLGDGDSGSFMTGFYIMNNAGIGLKCFALGMLLCVPGLVVLISNAITLGTVFGYMTTVGEPAHTNFFQFVTAHGPFELTAVVLSAAAGMRLGFSIVDTRGLSRADSVRKAGRETLPTACGAVVLFCAAALIEAFLSPSSAPYAVKMLAAVASTILLGIYFFVLGSRPGEADAT